MDNNFINIDDLVRQRLGGGEEQERAGAWMRMRDLLDKEEKVKPAGLYWRRMFGALGILLLLTSLSVGGYKMSASHKDGNPLNNQPILASNDVAAITTHSKTGNPGKIESDNSRNSNSAKEDGQPVNNGTQLNQDKNRESKVARSAPSNHSKGERTAANTPGAKGNKGTGTTETNGINNKTASLSNNSNTNEKLTTVAPGNKSNNSTGADNQENSTKNNSGIIASGSPVASINTLPVRHNEARKTHNGNKNSHTTANNNNTQPISNINDNNVTPSIAGVSNNNSGASATTGQPFANADNKVATGEPKKHRNHDKTSGAKGTNNNPAVNMAGNQQVNGSTVDKGMAGKLVANVATNLAKPVLGSGTGGANNKTIAAIVNNNNNSVPTGITNQTGKHNNHNGSAKKNGLGSKTGTNTNNNVTAPGNNSNTAGTQTPARHSRGDKKHAGTDAGIASGNNGPKTNNTEAGKVGKNSKAAKSGKPGIAKGNEGKTGAAKTTAIAGNNTKPGNSKGTEVKNGKTGKVAANTNNKGAKHANTGVRPNTLALGSHAPATKSPAGQNNGKGLDARSINGLGKNGQAPKNGAKAAGDNNAIAGSNSAKPGTDNGARSGTSKTGIDGSGEASVHGRMLIREFPKMTVLRTEIKSGPERGSYHFDTLSYERVMEYANAEETNTNQPSGMAARNSGTATNTNSNSAQNSKITPNSGSLASAKVPKEGTVKEGPESGTGKEAVQNLSMAFNDIKYKVGSVRFAPGLIAGINGTFFGPNSFKGFQFGLTGNFIFGENLTIMTELKYFHRVNNDYTMDDNYYNYTKDASGTYTKEQVTTTYSFSTLHSFELPVSVRYMVGNFDFFGGLNFLYNFAVNIEQAPPITGNAVPGTFTQPGPDQNPSLAVNDFNSRFGIGYLFGLSYQVSPNVMIDLRNVQTFWNTANTSGAQKVSEQLYKSPSLQISLGYRLGGKNKKD